MSSNENVKIRPKNNRKRKTTEEYKFELKIKSPEIIALEEYQGANIKIKHKHLVCGTVWEVVPSSLLQGTGCPQCAKFYIGKRLKQSQEEFKQKVYKKNSNIKIIGKYVSALDPIDCECLVCGHKWNPVADSLSRKNSSGCPKCANNAKKTHEEFMQDLEKVKNPNVIVLGKYTGAKDRILCKCKDCNHEWYATPTVLLRGNGCRKCGRVKFGLSCRLSHNDFQKRILNMNPYISLKTEYITAKDKIDCKCLLCGYEWSPYADDLIQGKGCPVCKLSHGELSVKTYLDKFNISYIHNAKSKDLGNNHKKLVGIGGNLLSYDFYLPQYNLLIECQGEQHEHSIEYFGGIKQFEKQQEHDKRKREYAKEHNIHLLEIWYYDIDNTENILTETLNNLKLESVETVISA